MAATQHQLSPAPFDAAAARYDETFTHTNVGKAQRNAVWRYLEHTFQTGQRVLEIGCGTGIDACFLATRGVRVVACDSSSQMLAVAGRRIAERRFQRMVQPVVLAAEDVASLHTSALFDGAFSNFGALNCVEDIGKFAADLAKLLKPGARALLVWIGPFCLWEMIWYLSHGDGKKVFRRFERKGVSARIAGGPTFSVSYPKIGSLADAFGPMFRMRSVRGIGVAVPPSYMEQWASRHLRLLNLFERSDVILGRLPGIRTLADHVLLEFERTNANATPIEGART